MGLPGRSPTGRGDLWMYMKSIVREEDAEDKVQVEDESLWRPLEGTAQRRRRYDLVHQCLKRELCFRSVLKFQMCNILKPIQPHLKQDSLPGRRPDHD